MSLGVTTAVAAQALALTPLDPARADQPPILAGSRVVWTTDRPWAPGLYSINEINLKTMPVDGGARTQLQPITTNAGYGFGPWEVAGSETTIAVRTYTNPQALDGKDEVYVERGDGAFRPVPGPVRPATRFSTGGLDHVVAGDDVLTLEFRKVGGDFPLVKHAPGAARVRIPLPEGAEETSGRVAGDLLAVEVADKTPAEGDAPVAIAILDAHTGAELRRLAVPKEFLLSKDEFYGDGDLLGGIEIGADGSVVAGLRGAPRRFGWAAPDATRLTPLVVPRGLNVPLALAAGRFVTVVGHRIVAATLPDFQVLYRSLPSNELTLGGFDGERLAYQSATCSLLARISDGPVTSMPEGPCLRSDAAVQHRSTVARRFPVRVRCLLAPESSCDISARVRGGGGTRRAMVPVGSTKTFVFRLARRLVRYHDPPEVTVRVTDPGGMSETFEDADNY